MGALYFEVGIDIRDFDKKILQIENSLKRVAQNAANSGSILDRSFQSAGKSANALGGDVGSLQRNLIGLASVATIGRLGQQIITIRGEFQQLGIAFEVMLGSKEKADKLMQEAVLFAQKTPFTLTDVATNIKQLLAMGIATDKVMQTMKSLGDVAAGVSVPIARVAINYGQVATLGKLQGREIRDFAMAGIPLIDELAKNLGKAKSEITDMVEAGQIGFPEVERAFQTMSGEGGKFYNLMEKQNASVTGQISNLTDKLQVMFNEIGESNEGLIYGAIGGASSLISHYEGILSIIEGLIVGYGVYRTAIILTGIAQSFHTAQAAASVFTMAGTLTKLTFAQYASAKAQGTLNAVMAINPWVAAATLIAAVGVALYAYSDNATKAEESQTKLNESMNEQKVKIDGLVSTIKNINAAKADQVRAEKDLNALMPEGTNHLNAQTLATKEGSRAISDYINSVRTRMQIEQLNADLIENLNNQDRIANGKLTVVERLKAGFTQGGVDWEKIQSAKIFKLKEEADAIAKRRDEIISSGKAETDAGKEILTVEQQLTAAKKAKADAQSLLNKMRMPDSISSAKEIDDQQAVVDSYKKSIETLTGIKLNEKKVVDELKQAQEQLEAAVKSGDNAAAQAAARRITQLEKEKKSIQDIMDLELQRAWRSQFDGQGMKPMSSIGTKPIAQVGSQKTVQGILYEITAIDKTGPVWKKAGLEVGKLKKKADDGIKDSAEAQKKLDEENAERKERINSQILNAARQFTSELINQLGLSEKTAANLDGMVGIMTSVASGDYPAAVAGAAMRIVNDVKGLFTKDDPTQENLDQINKLLQVQSEILSNLAGSDYFKLATKQYNDLGESIDLNNKKLRESNAQTNEEYDAQVKRMSGWRTSFKQWNFASVSDTWNPQQWIDAFLAGQLVLNEEGIAWINDMIAAQADRVALVQEVFREALGFDSSEVSDSIFQGIEDGLKLGENNLGGFAETFGELMNTALMQAITDATNLSITTKFLPKVQEFLQNSDVGPNGEKLTEGELLILEELYANEVRTGQEVTDALKPITDKYGTSAAKQAGIKGVSASATEETVSAMVGQTMAMRVDLKYIQTDLKIIQETGINALELMDQSLSALNNIDRNTKPIFRLEAIENSVNETNRILKEKL